MFFLFIVPINDSLYQSALILIVIIIYPFQLAIYIGFCQSIINHRFILSTWRCEQDKSMIYDWLAKAQWPCLPSNCWSLQWMAVHLSPETNPKNERVTNINLSGYFYYIWGTRKNMQRRWASLPRKLFMISLPLGMLHIKSLQSDTPNLMVELNLGSNLPKESSTTTPRPMVHSTMIRPSKTLRHSISQAPWKRRSGALIDLQSAVADSDVLVGSDHVRESALDKIVQSE